ncbi:MAG TPA: metallophosphoesterase [Elusimicrobiota bacterium]|nr:metallophosphoesterase [Elusimicrobiota bacterium]
MRPLFLAAAAALLFSSAASAGPGVVEISDPSAYSQVLAISDVHGMRPALDALLKGAGVVDASGRWSAGNSLLIVVGDSIDKGPQSLEVLDEWIALSAQASAAGGRVVHTLGNHEAEFLADPNDSRKAAELYAELQAKGVPASDLADPATPYGKFLAGMPLAARVGRWLFCHAGLYPGPSWKEFSAAADSAGYGDPLLSADDSILEAKDWWKDPSARASLESRLEADGLYGLVQGHQPKAYGFPNRTGSLDGGRLVKIDNGMAPEAGSHAGSILRFPKPGQLSAAAPPEMQVVGPDGSASPVPGR